jgi:hypothetical protein
MTMGEFFLLVMRNNVTLFNGTGKPAVRDGVLPRKPERKSNRGARIAGGPMFVIDTRYSQPST